MQANRARYVRVLIAADHPPSIDKIRGLVFPDFEVVGTVNGVGEQALRHAFQLKPDIILVEVAVAIKDHFEVATTISQQLPRTWIIFFQNGTDSPAREASADTTSSVRRRNSASSDGSDVAWEADQAMPGRRSSVNGARHCPEYPASHQELSGREYEVLGLLAAGYPMKQIAFRLGITYRTVTFHKYRMMERLGSFDKCRSYRVRTEERFHQYGPERSHYSGIVSEDRARRTRGGWNAFCHDFLPAYAGSRLHRHRD